MSRQVIDVHARSSASRESVWRVIADTRSWARWGPWEEAALEREGKPRPDGVGALRRFRSVRRLAGRPVVTREEVTLFEPPSVLGYKLLSGLPLRDYEARITLFDDSEQTAIHWRCEFNPKLPGTGGLLRRELGKVIADVAERAAREGERLADTPVR